MPHTHNFVHPSITKLPINHHLAVGRRGSFSKTFRHTFFKFLKQLFRTHCQQAHTESMKSVSALYNAVAVQEAPALAPRASGRASL